MIPANGHDAAYDAVVVGGGPIGLAIAWRAARGDARVAMIDPDCGSGASFAAAGMLAPVTEAHYGEEELLRLNLASADLYPAFVQELETLTGHRVGYRTCGTLTVAFDAGDRAALDDMVDYHRRLGLDAHLIGGREARALEPLLAPGIVGGVVVPGDHQVDPRRLTAALAEACRQTGVVFIPTRAQRVLASGGRVQGVTLEDGGVVAAAAVVVAAGCWSRDLTRGIDGADLPVRPVKGQILTLFPPPGNTLLRPMLGRNLRALVEGRTVYLVPREDSRVVLGATVEEKGFDTSVTIEAVYDLLRAARLVLPAAAEMELIETVAGLRPGSPDNAPMIGTTAISGLLAATGHYRNGILLTPITAHALAELIAGRPAPGAVAPFSPTRFVAP